ncbi:hypothetical protein [Thiorhodovibrio winogradskyi]|nr:hypothetical protein [Thiorhodovibrio winogradskyi]
MSNPRNDDETGAQGSDAPMDDVPDNASSEDGSPELARAKIVDSISIGCIFAPYRPRVAGMSKAAYAEFLEDL